MIFQQIIEIIASIFMTVLFGWCFIEAADSTTRICVLPFLTVGVVLLIRGIVGLILVLKVRKGKKDDNVSAESVFNLDIAHKIINMLGFILFWFGFLIIFDYFAIKQSQMSMLVASLIFWALGI